jgi:hypothetical protein
MKKKTPRYGNIFFVSQEQKEKYKEMSEGEKNTFVYILAKGVYETTLRLIIEEIKTELEKE